MNEGKKGTTEMSLGSIEAIGRIKTTGTSGGSYVAWADGQTHVLLGNPLAGDLTLGERVEVEESGLLVPIEPTKIVAAAVNYVSHAIRRDPPTKPELFYKPISSLASQGTQVILPPDADIVESEGEIVLVIGKRAKNLTAENAAEHLLGYTAGFDISARNFQRGDRHFWRAKGCDTFSPVGPRIRLGAPSDEVALVTRVNGEEKQRTTVGEMIFSPVELLVFATRYITLEPGDLFFTGTPGVPPGIASGDAISVELDGAGTLRMDVA
jgi:2-keto-4-pentenoate hydratase/2-oxohepta-3-ene-1,7-dioic acid hydratase in catechol pathway